MNYLKHYRLLIESRTPLVREKSFDKYFELHHVVPKCQGGKDGKTILLTAREHYIAHLLLYKAYPNDNKLALAYWWMSNNSKVFHKRDKINSRSYDRAKKALSVAQMGNKYNVGRKCSEETKKKIGLGNKGKKISDEVKRKIRELQTGRIISVETRRKLSNSHVGHSVTQATREKIRSALVGKSLSLEHRKKLSISHMGNKSGLGYKHTNNARLKMSIAAKRLRKPLSEETKKKISLALIARKSKLIQTINNMVTNESSEIGVT